MVLCTCCKTIQKAGFACSVCRQVNVAVLHEDELRKEAEYDWSGVEDGVARKPRLPNRERIDVNERLIKAGLDGNGRFANPSVGLAAAQNVLAAHGIEVLDEPNSWALTKYDQFRLNLDVGWTNQDDSFSPVSIDNSMLFFTWYRLDEDVYECLAYLS
jgi:hypothetical protein